VADPEGPWRQYSPQPTTERTGSRPWTTVAVVAGLLFAAALVFAVEMLTQGRGSFTVPLLIILVLLAVARARGTKRFDPLAEPRPGDRPRNFAVLIALVMSSLWAFFGLLYWFLSFFAADFSDDDDPGAEAAAALALRLFGTAILVWCITNIVAATHHLRGERWARTTLIVSFSVIAGLAFAICVAFFPGGMILGAPHLAAAAAVVAIAARPGGGTPTLR
jgi:hypothetical protein